MALDMDVQHAVCVADLGRVSEALAMLDATLLVQERVLGTAHPSTLETSRALARVRLSISPQVTPGDARGAPPPR